MKKLCFLSTDGLEKYVIDDDLAIAPLNELGYDVETVSWRSSRDWNEFDAVVIRTTWDYHHSPSEFENKLEEIDLSSARLENALDLVRWNIQKTYLLDLAEKDVSIVPTIISRQLIDQSHIVKWKGEFNSDQIVIKPTISATARNTFLVSTYKDNLEVFRGSTYMVQPMMSRIATEGEYSLFYFDSEFSHAILKTPKSGDFRVQEDFGGSNKPITPGPEMLEFAESLLKKTDFSPLYARIDVVYDEEEAIRLMELELIEPALYFRYDEKAPRLFADKLHARINEL